MDRHLTTQGAAVAAPRERVEPDEPLQSLLSMKPEVSPPSSLPSAVVGELVAIVDEGRTPLVSFAGKAAPGAQRARSTVAVEARHLGQPVVLVFEAGDVNRPVVVGVLCEQPAWPLGEAGGNVEVDADGASVIVSARHQLVLRCGSASIVLSSDGKVELRGRSIVTQATGANRIRGGSVELN